MLCTTISFVEMHDVAVCYAGRTAANITVLGLLNGISEPEIFEDFLKN